MWFARGGCYGPGDPAGDGSVSLSHHLPHGFWVLQAFIHALLQGTLSPRFPEGKEWEKPTASPLCFSQWIIDGVQARGEIVLTTERLWTWEAKHDRTGLIRGGLRHCDSLSWAVRPDSANGALPRSFTCSPLCWASVTGLKEQLRLLLLLLHSPSHSLPLPSTFSCPLLNCRTDQSGHLVQKIPNNADLEGKRQSREEGCDF